ncbi:MAG: hypothetical protein ACKV2Q_31455 [Planctomycetaceae bacterium]
MSNINAAAERIGGPTSTTPSRATKRARRATAAEQAQAAHALVSAVIESGEASTDEAHRRYELPPSVEQRVWGAVTTQLLAEGVLRRVGDVHTRRSVAHGRRIGRYVLANGNRARRYRDTLAATAARKRPTQRTLFDNEED